MASIYLWRPHRKGVGMESWNLSRVFRLYYFYKVILLFIFVDRVGESHNWSFFVNVWHRRCLYERSVVNSLLHLARSYAVIMFTYVKVATVKLRKTKSLAMKLGETSLFTLPHKTSFWRFSLNSHTHLWKRQTLTRQNLSKPFNDQGYIKNVLLVVSATKRRRDIKIPLCLSTPVRESLIVSNDNRCTHKFDFSVFDRKFPLRANLVKKIKMSV